MPDAVESMVAVRYPLYLRKVDRRTQWDGRREPDMAARVQGALDEVFKDDGGFVSVYRVIDVFELKLVAVALNSNRDSLTEDLALLLIEEDELAGSGLSLVREAGETECYRANGLHRDLRYDRGGLSRLVADLYARDRKSIKLTSAKMRVALQAVTEHGCRVVTEKSTKCPCDSNPYPSVPKGAFSRGAAIGRDWVLQVWRWVRERLLGRRG